MTTFNRTLYISASVLLLTLYAVGRVGAGTTTDGNFAGSAEWGMSNAQSFDFIVVGTGAAGAVVAARLSASNNWTVLLLEAGGPSQRDLGGDDYVASSFTKDPRTGTVVRGEPWTRIDVPMFYPSIIEAPVHDEYNYNIAGAENGRTMGGSMAHNGMFWGHPTPNNIAVWNVTGWSYNQFIPYVKKVENYTRSGLTVDSSVGTNGAVQVRKAAVITPTDLNFFNACIAANIPFQPNFQSPNGIAGVGYSAYNIGNNGTSIRQTTALTYLAPILSSPTLTISLYSQVARVLFTSCPNTAQRCTPAAYGVEYVVTSANGRQTKRVALAGKEVILSGGALMTPQTLILSGVGPSSQLTKFGIAPVYINENVGKNIRNHLATGVAYTGENVIQPNLYSVSDVELSFGLDGTGLYAATGLGAIQAHVKTVSTLPDPDIVFLGNSFTATPLTQGFSVTLIAANPEYSYGAITLNTSNPLDEPIYTPNVTLSLNDVNTLVRGIQQARKIMNTAKAQSYFGTETSPGAAISSTAQLQTWVRANTGIVYHYYGSCKMGNNGDAKRVVDNNLRVVGVNNLRVVDASVIPAPVHFIIQATVAAIGEKASDAIIAAWA